MSPSDSLNDFRSWRLMLFNELLLQMFEDIDKDVEVDVDVDVDVDGDVYMDIHCLIDFIVG